MAAHRAGAGGGRPRSCADRLATGLTLLDGAPSVAGDRLGYAGSGMGERPTHEQTIERLRRLFTGGGHEQVVAVSHEAARPARLAPLPGGLHPAVATALAAAGIDELFSHQRDTFDLIGAGHNVVLATGTASGKSLAFVLPTLDAAARDPQARALYLYPTKALAQDQARKLTQLRAGALAYAKGRPASRGREEPRRPEPPARRRGAAQRPTPCGRSCRRSTTATRRRASGPPSARTPPSCSRTPTCCTSASCRRTNAGPSSSISCGTSSSTRLTSTAACSVRTSRRSCAACGASARSTADVPSSCSPRRPSPTRRSSPSGSSACPSRRSTRTGPRTPSGPSSSGTRRSRTRRWARGAAPWPSRATW